MRSARAGRVVVVGTLNLDAIWHVPALPRPGQTVIAETVEQQFGGKGANQAVAAARQAGERHQASQRALDGQLRQLKELDHADD